MSKKITFDAPISCSRCPAIRNNEFGFKCFLTEEDLDNHDIDVLNDVGLYCPAKEIKKCCSGCDHLSIDNDRHCLYCRQTKSIITVDIRTDVNSDCPIK